MRDRPDPRSRARTPSRSSAPARLREAAPRMSRGRLQQDLADLRDAEIDFAASDLAHHVEAVGRKMTLARELLGQSRAFRSPPRNGCPRCRPPPDRCTPPNGRRRSAARNASTVETSGLGKPLRTATPTRTVPRSRTAPALPPFAASASRRARVFTMRSGRSPPAIRASTLSRRREFEDDAIPRVALERRRGCRERAL